MTNPIPPVEFFAPPVPSSGYGLYSAATIFEVSGPVRELGGVNIWPYNCDDGGFGEYDPAMCDPGEPEVKAPGTRAEPVTFEPMVVYGASECAPDQTEDEVFERARHIRTLHEPLQVEEAFATMILADAGAPTVAASFAEAIGLLEEAMGEWGYQGYIHLGRRWAGIASQYRWSNQAGPVLRSPLDHRYVFGGGYGDVLGDTLVATGTPFIWRSTPFERVETTGSHVTAAYNNSVYAVSERIVVAGYECAAIAVTIDSTP